MRKLEDERRDIQVWRTEARGHRVGSSRGSSCSRGASLQRLQLHPQGNQRLRPTSNKIGGRTLSPITNRYRQRQIIGVACKGQKLLGALWSVLARRPRSIARRVEINDSAEFLPVDAPHQGWLHAALQVPDEETPASGADMYKYSRLLGTAPHVPLDPPRLWTGWIADIAPLPNPLPAVSRLALVTLPSGVGIIVLSSSLPLFSRTRLVNSHQDTTSLPTRIAPLVRRSRAATTAVLEYDHYRDDGFADRSWSRKGTPAPRRLRRFPVRKSRRCSRPPSPLHIVASVRPQLDPRTSEVSSYRQARRSFEMIDQRNVDLQSVKVRFLCGHGHRELKFRRNKLKYLSRVFGSRLNELKDTDKVLLIKQDEFHNTGFSCWTMDAVLRTWHSNTSEFQRSMDNKREPYFTMFEELHALSLLLYTWECRISDFTTFAEQTRDEEVRVGQKGYMTLFDKEAMNGDNATKWAFISLVFGWKEQFSQSFLAIQRLGVEAATQSSQSTIRSAPYASQSYEEDVLRDIIRKSDTAMFASQTRQKNAC